MVSQRFIEISGGVDFIPAGSPSHLISATNAIIMPFPPNNAVIQLVEVLVMPPLKVTTNPIIGLIMGLLDTVIRSIAGLFGMAVGGYGGYMRAWRSEEKKDKSREG